MISAIVHAYLELEARRIGQAAFARIVGTQRQGVNAILTGRAGRRFTFHHLSRYAQHAGIPAGEMFEQLAAIAERIEQLSPTEEEINRHTPVDLGLPEFSQWSRLGE